MRAQELYFSISGQDVQVESGDNSHVYEYWIVPKLDANPVTLQIFDAGIGGVADVISNQDQTVATTYQLYPFDSRYNYQEGNLTSINEGSASLLVETTAKSENQFKDRWVSLADLDASEYENGFLLRVSAGSGSDVNSYKLRLIDETGQDVTNNNWKIVAIDLSVGLYQTDTNYEYQLAPFDEALSPDTPLVIAGEEDSNVEKADLFGNRVAPMGEINGISQRKYGITNSWGIAVKGNSAWINNLTIRGADNPVLWRFQPTLFQADFQPRIQVQQAPGNDCNIMQFELVSQNINGADLAQTQWVEGEQLRAEGRDPAITYQEPGNKSITALTPNSRSYFPAYWITELRFTVNSAPIVNLTASKSRVAPNQPITLRTEGSSDPNGDDLMFQWYVNNTLRANGTTFTFQNSVPGVYTVAVVASDGRSTAACSETKKEITLRVNSKPYTEIDYTPLFGTDEPLPFLVQNSSDADNDQLSYEWKGSGITGNTTGREVTVSHQEPGNYTIAMTVDDNTGTSNATYTTEVNYEVNAAPRPMFNIPDQKAPGNEILLDASPSSDLNPDNLSYQWMIDGQEIADTEKHRTKFDAPGDYEITLIVDDNRNVSNSVQQISKQIHINAPPQPIITADSISNTARQQFSAANSSDPDNDIASYLWNFGDGTQAAGMETFHLYDEAGTYTVTLSVDDAQGQTNSIQKKTHTLTINSYPVAAFSLPKVVAPNQLFTLDASPSTDRDGEVTAYTWRLNGQEILTSITDELRIEESGMHSITLQVNDDSGFEEAIGMQSEQMRVNHAPVIQWRVDESTLVPNTEVILDASESFDEDGSINQVTWIFEDGERLTGAQVSKSFSDPGTKNFTIQVDDGENLANSIVRRDVQIQINHAPFIVTEKLIRSNTYNIPLDASESYDLDDDHIDYSWRLPDGTQVNKAAFNWKAPGSGVYMIGLIVHDGKNLPNSQTTESIRVLINKPVQPVVDSLIHTCTGETVLFSSADSYDPDGDAYSVRWSFGEGTTTQEPNPTFSYDQTGTYEAKAEFSDGFSTKPSIAKIPVIVEGAPVARMNIPDTTVCVNSPIRFDGTQSSDPSGALASFGWKFGDGQSATGPSVNYLFSNPGTYTVQLTVQGSGTGRCGTTSQVSREVTVVAGPKADFDIPEWISPQKSLSLEMNTPMSADEIRSVSWFIEGEQPTDTLSGSDQEYRFDEPGNYTITLFVENNSTTSCNTLRISKEITVNSAPDVTWKIPAEVAAGENIWLDASGVNDKDGFIKNFEWFVDGEYLGNSVTQEVTFEDHGEHTVRLIATDNATSDNNRVVTEKNLYVNAAPNTNFTMPGVVYQNQSISLFPETTTDADGDELTSKWMVNGDTLTAPNIYFDEPVNYTIKLIQRDGRGLSNSIDSAVVNVVPKRIPKIEPRYPNKLITNTFLNTEQLNLPDSVYFVDNGQTVKRWAASQIGIQEMVIGWKPGKTILYKDTLTTEALAPLQFEQQPDKKVIPWNPANPRITLSAPPVNRKTEGGQYLWKGSDNTILGTGTTVQVPVKEGLNTIVLSLTEQGVYGAKAIQTEFVVETER